MENILNFETLKETETILCAAIYVNDLQKYAHQPTNIVNGFVVSGYWDKYSKKDKFTRQTMLN